MVIGLSDSRCMGVLMCVLLCCVIEWLLNIGDIYEGAVNRENVEVNGIMCGMVSVLSLMFFMCSKLNKDVIDNMGFYVVIKCVYIFRFFFADECVNLFLALCTYGVFGNCDENLFCIVVKNMKDILLCLFVVLNKRFLELVDFEWFVVVLSVFLCIDVGLLFSYVMLFINLWFVLYLSLSVVMLRFV